MDWTSILDPGESLRWEGRPAPRCFTFRRWHHSLFGALLLILAAYWQFVGYQLSVTYRLPALAWVPVPFLVAGIYFFAGHLFLARREWEHVFYAVTDRRLLVQRGLFRRRLETLGLKEITYFKVTPLGENLGTVRIRGGEGTAPLEVPCLEYPRRMTDFFEEAMGGEGSDQ
ncbi:MAG TPA: PH domain-containing protein [Gammaproteobacteria bacterium]|nr:PH domain-containing protein [Gammaproteobacteria bacterium]